MKMVLKQHGLFGSEAKSPGEVIEVNDKNKIAMFQQNGIAEPFTGEAKQDEKPIETATAEPVAEQAEAPKAKKRTANKDK